MLNIINIDNLPRLKRPHYEMKLITKISFANNKDLYCAIKQDHLIQLAIGMTYNSNSIPSNVIINLPKDLSPIEVINIPTIQTLLVIFRKVHFLIGKRNNVIGVQVSKLSIEALETYLLLASSNKLDTNIKTLFRPFNGNINFIKDQLCAFQLKDTSERDNFNIMSLLINNSLYLFLLSEAMRNKDGAFITLFGWKKAEIENNDLFTNLLLIFKNVFLLGYVNGENEWLSIQLIVSQPYEHINSLDDF